TRGFGATGQSPRLLPCWTCGLSPWERPIFPSSAGYTPRPGTRGQRPLESGQPATAALKSVGQSWDSGQVQLFDRLVTPEFSKFVAENQPETEAKPTDLAALARACRGFAVGLNPSKK